MTLRSRLSFGLVIIAACLVAPLALAIQSLETLHKTRRSNNRDFAASLLIARLREGLNEVRREELALLFKPDSTSRDDMTRGLTRVQATSDSLATHSLRNAKIISGSVNQLRSVADQEFAATLAARPDSADTLSARLFVPALNTADSLVRETEHRAVRADAGVRSGAIESDRADEGRGDHRTGSGADRRRYHRVSCSHGRSASRFSICEQAWPPSPTAILPTD